MPKITAEITFMLNFLLAYGKRSLAEMYKRYPVANARTAVFCAFGTKKAREALQDRG